MIDLGLYNYVKREIANGTTALDITETLKKAGWSEAVISETIREVKNPENAAPPESGGAAYPESATNPYYFSSRISKRRIIRFVKILACLLILGSVYFHYFRYLDPASGCNISMPVSILEWNNGNIYQALNALKYGDPDEYKLVCQNVKKIVLGPGCGGWEGGCFYPEKPDEIVISTGHDEFIGWTAAIIAHETCHDIQNKSGRQLSETECYALGHQTLLTLVESSNRPQQ